MSENDEIRQIAIRLPAKLLDRVDAHAARLKHRSPGVGVSRADAIRSLLHEALTSAETATKGGPS
jgi:metal-responsive CopG/Arc/MetJ family transcriptional regulator